MNKLFPLVIFLSIGFLAFGQKKKLTHEDYDHWKSIGAYSISQKGNYVNYEINPQQGDGTLYVYDVKTKETHSFERGYGAQISYEEGFMVFKMRPLYEETREAKRKEKKKNEMPKTHVVIVDLQTWGTDTIKNAKSFTMPEKHEGWLAVKLDDASKKKEEKKEKKEKEEAESSKEETKEETKKEEEKEAKPEKKTPKNRVLLMQLGEDYSDTLNWVSEFVFAAKQPELLFSQSNEKVDSIKGVYAYNAGRVEMLDTTGESFSNLVIDESGMQMTWVSTKDSSDAKVRMYDLNFYADGSLKKMTPDYEGMPTGMMVSEFYKPAFSEDGKQLFIEVRKIPEAIEEDTMELKEEKVYLDIWSWTDTLIQPAQLKKLKQTKEKGYRAVLHTGDLKLVRLEQNYYDEIRYNKKNITAWLPVSNSARTYKSLSWDYPIAEDYYLVNVNTGERKLMVEGLKGYAYVSPGGKYFYGYDKAAEEWFAVKVSGGEKLKLNQFKDPVWNVENDVPALAGSYGVSGWTEGDEAVLINTQFSIWHVDLNDIQNPVELTPQQKDNPIRYRYQTQDDEAIFVSNELMLHAFEEKTKREGYASVLLSGEQFQQVKDFESMRYMGFDKAKKSSSLIIRKGNFVDYPEIYYLSSWKDAPLKLSETNPQQKEYNWGTTELVHWKGKGGAGKLDGILIKPENFDPNKKYPVLIYFYERYSDLLNYHFGFKPSASTINFAYFASNEYVIFVPDVVYKTGYPGKSAYNCIVSGASWLAKQPFVDADKMAIQGQSWGGYQVAYLVTQTDMFACAMAGAPVSNMTSAYGGIRWGSGWSREFQYEKTQSRLGGTLWDSRKLYIENSPVFYADQVNTPLLMMHNDDDGAVPWYQGIEYFMALRRLDKPTWMLVYNKEAHNLRKRHNKKDLSIRMGQFFDHYLKGAPAPEWMIEGRKANEKETNKAY